MPPTALSNFSYAGVKSQRLNCKVSCAVFRRSAFVIAVWNGTPSGTGQTVMLARESKRSLTIINPDTMEISRINQADSSKEP